MPRRSVLYSAAAVRGSNAAAAYKTGEMYTAGRGAKRDHEEAAHWYRKAADAGYSLALFKMGYIYSKGLGVPANQAEAVSWYREAAKKNVAAAEYEFGPHVLPRPRRQSATTGNPCIGIGRPQVADTLLPSSISA